MPVFTIRTQASDISDITYTYPYIYWLPDYKSLIVSNTVLGGYTIEDSNGILLRNLDENVYEETSTTKAYLLTIANYQQGDCYTLVYNEVTGWEARQPVMVRKRLVATVYTAPMVTLYSGERVYTNGQSVPSPYSSAGTTLPDDIPPLDGVQDAINAALNATTSATTEANTIQTNIYNTYNSYTTREITEEEFVVAMAEYQSQLEELANRTSNTLADNIAINNAITYQDLIINQQVNNVNPTLQAKLYSYKSNIGLYFTQYKDGTLTQSEAMSKIQSMLTGVSSYVNEYTSTADLNAINAVINYGNSVIDSIASYADLDSTVSESAESSDAAEKEYLDSLVSETTATIQEISPKDTFTDVEMGTAQEVLGIIWENKLIKRLLVICGCFMVVCVVLGIRYKV